MKPIVFVIILFALTTTLAAQWLKYPTPGIPRTANGKPNLAAPAPRTADGKPDLSGIWQRISAKYSGNVAADLKPGEIQSWAEALVRQRAEDFRKDSPGIQCLPWGPAESTSARKTKIVQAPGLILMLDEALTYRQIFMEDRKSTRLNSSHRCISYAVFCLKKKKKNKTTFNMKFYNLTYEITS